MNISINQKFTAGSLIRFALPSIIMMMFMSCYTIIDGIFVSRFVGSNAFSSLNMVYPMLSLVIAVATMLATGGNAIVSIYLGQGEKQKARESMTMFVVAGVTLSLVVCIFTNIFLTQICRALGANDLLLADSRTYLLIVMCFAPACMLQTLFQSYLVTAGKAAYGLVLTIIAGITNAVLDYVLIVPCDMGIAGAAFATGIGQLIPAAAGVIFFFTTKKELHFVKFKFQLKTFWDACYNGSSEMVGQFANAIITFLFNIIMIRLVGEHGVAAISILLYGQFLFNAFYMGLSIGISPVIGFQYGAGNKKQLKDIYKVTMLFTLASSLIMMLISSVAASGIVSVFTKDQKTYELAVVGFRIFAWNFLFSGFNIISSGIFTALSNGKISALISFARTLVFLVASLFVFPMILGVAGVWIAVPIAEFMTMLMCIPLHIKYFHKKGEKNYFMSKTAATTE